MDESREIVRQAQKSPSWWLRHPAIPGGRAYQLELSPAYPRRRVVTRWDRGIGQIG